MDRPEVALAGPEHDGDDVHAHLVDQARGKHMATDVAGRDLDDAVTRKLLRLGYGCLDAVDEWNGASGSQPSGFDRCVTTTTWSTPRGAPLLWGVPNEKFVS